jgi:translation initiation factor IF-3
MLHKERGYTVLTQITESLEDLAKVEQPSTMTGRRLKLLLVPNK